jgi:hypothetical protein
MRPTSPSECCEIRLPSTISEVISLDHAEHAMQRAAAPGVLKVLLSR